ncbi:MAG TPA: hypothetical protein VFC19_36885 [Candidatus Limnocylindrales bacterium]|nr:hypothetical protein [Candidatus Limnocylindrales bacterium]
MSTTELIYLIEPADPAQDSIRNTIGGRPILPAGMDWPVCHCGLGMIFFFQLDIPDDVADFGGDHLLVFQCPKHNDACFPPPTPRLPARYWDQPPPPNQLPFWRIILGRGGEAHPDADPHLRPRPLALCRSAEMPDQRGKGMRAFKLSGVPSWAQDPERYQCACGTDLKFLCQVPEDFEFETLAGQEEQPGWYSADNYALFLGNEIYLLACPAHCHPAAVWPVNQN